MSDTRRKALYGRRRGHPLRQGRAELLATTLPRLQVALADAPAPAAWFAKPYARYELEIGFGGGEHLAARAAAHPDTGFIGCEFFINGIAKLLAAVADGGHENIRIHDGDAHDVLAVLPPASLSCVHLLYPDPWPKRRHHKRRFINAENLDTLFRILAPDGRLMLASDFPDYVGWMLAQIRAHGGFSWDAISPRDWTDPPADWTGTRYEAKARTAGRPPTYLAFTRRKTAKSGHL